MGRPSRRIYVSVPHYLPSPEEIRQKCLEIQEGWSETERARRAGVNHVGQADLHTYSQAIHQGRSYLVTREDR
jgi:hypothetical protein